jgi:hypothetical protein
MPYIIDSNEYKKLSQDALEFKGYESRISSSELFFFEWGLALSSKIIPLIDALNKASGDNSSYLGDIEIIEDASRLSNYLDKLKQYPILKFSTPISETIFREEIIKFFIVDQSFDSRRNVPINHGYSMSAASQYIHFSPSKLWRIYSEAYDELGVLETAIGFPEGITFPRILDGKTRDEAFEECRPSF